MWAIHSLRSPEIELQQSPERSEEYLYGIAHNHDNSDNNIIIINNDNNNDNNNNINSNINSNSSSVILACAGAMEAMG